jgi:hypothetical protein
MSVWTEFMGGYREARPARPRRRQRRKDLGTDAQSPFIDTVVDDPAYDRLHQLFEACSAELASCRRALADLGAEARRQRAEATDGDEKFRRLALVTQKFLHPDRAAGDAHLAAALEDISKELRAEIDKLERGA